MTQTNEIISRGAGNKAKQEFHRTYMLAMIVTSFALAGIMGYIFIDAHTRPLISTSHYHFNVQYRAGSETAMDEVVNNSLIPVLLMYQRHPKWRANIEFQGLMLDWMEKMDARAAAGNITLRGGINSSIDLLKNVTSNGQIQLVLMQYSNALALAYPYIDMYKSINYTRYRLEELGFINETSGDTSAVSRVVLLQEGQFMLGASRNMLDFKHQDGSPIYDTFLTTRESLSYFGVDKAAPIYTHTTGGKSIYVLPYHITGIEAGAIHHVLWFQDGENLNTDSGETWGDSGLINQTDSTSEFSYNEEMQLNHEARLKDLEEQGNIFLTLDEWVDYLLERNQVKPLGRHIPETHWAVFRYRSSFIWMGETKGETSFDDNEINARNYQTHQQLLATEALLNYTFYNLTTSLTSGEYNQLYANLSRCWLWLAEAQVTDSTGLSPRCYEGDYAFNVTRDALAESKIIQKYIINATPALNDTLYNQNGTIQILPSNIMGGNPVISINGSINFTDNGLVSLNVIDPITINCMNNDSFSMNQFNLETPFDSSLNGLNYYSVKANFPKTNNSGYTEKWSYIKFNGNFNKMRYSPSLWENITVELDRDDYNVDKVDYYQDWDEQYIDNFEIYMALSNGMMYSPAGNYAIVKNCTTTHLAVKWNDNDLRFMQTETRSKINPSGEEWEYFVLMNVSVDQAVAFANLVNTYAPVTIHRGVLP